MDWILVIYESPDMAAVIESCVAGPLKAQVVHAANLAMARKALRGRVVDDCKLIVSSVAPPLDADCAVAVDRSIPTVIGFLREVRGGGDAPPCILIDPAPTFKLNEALQGLNGVLIMAVRDVAGYLGANARSLVMGNPVHDSQETHLLDVDISISGEICNWQLIGKNGVGISEMGSIKLNKDSIERLLVDSETVGRISSNDAMELRRRLLRRLGRDLYDCIDDPTIAGGLWETVSHYTNRMRLLEKTRFRFQVDSVSSQLLVEALTRKDRERPDEDDYWLLRMPMIRRFGSSSDRFPLFKDQKSREQPVQCLIILGNPKAFSAGNMLAKAYPAICNASDEVTWLKKYLSEDQSGFGLAEPKLLRYDDHRIGSFGAVVRSTLREGHWQLIHYSGHSDVDADGTGYLVLGDDDEDLMTIDDFARSAAHAQFIFLNSCRSANARFVQRSVERSIPAMAGYAWPIRDDIAAAFSREFYRNLFGVREKLSNRFLEYAFMRARRYLHKAYENESAWSAPLLFMQSMHSEPPSMKRSLS